MTCIDVTKPERSQRQFVALCQYRFFTYDHVTYEDFIKFLNLHTLHKTLPRCNIFISVYSGLKCSPSLLDITCIRGLPRTCRNSSLCTAWRKIWRWKMRKVLRSEVECWECAAAVKWLSAPLCI